MSTSFDVTQWLADCRKDWERSLSYRLQIRAAAERYGINSKIYRQVYAEVKKAAASEPMPLLRLIEAQKAREDPQ